MRLTGYDAIAFAEREALPLHKDADAINGPAEGLTVAEAEAIAADRPDLIWVEVDDERYHNLQSRAEDVPTNSEPQR
jgi:hypothetical protein